PIDVTVEEWSTRQDQTPMKITARDLSQAVVSRPGRALASLTLRKGKNFPTPAPEIRRDAFDHELPPVSGLYVLYGRNLHRLKENGDRLELDTIAGPLASLLQTDKFTEFGVGYDPWSSVPFGRNKLREPNREELFQGMFYVLLTRSLELVDQQEVEQFSLPPDRARLLVYAHLPESLFVTDPRFRRQSGYVLYCLDIFEPEKR
ncbi:MAG TPA: hypothetical protein VGH74_17285, partial [Planctomycetaceae bacterium]